MTKKFKIIAAVTVTRLTWRDWLLRKMDNRMSTYSWLRAWMMTKAANREPTETSGLCRRVHKMVQELFSQQPSCVTTMVRTLTWAHVYEVTSYSLQKEVFFTYCVSAARDVQDISNARINNSFLTQVIKKLRGRSALLDLIVTKKEELVRDVKGRDKLGCRNHEMVDIRILKIWNGANSRTTVLNFWRAEFVLFRDLLERIP